MTETLEAPSRSTDTSTREVERLLSSLRDLAGVSRRIDMVGFEEQPAQMIREQLYPLVVHLGTVALHIIAKLQARYDAPCAEDSAETGPTDPPPSSETADVLFVARMQVGQALEDLKVQKDIPDHWDLIGQCNRFRGVVITAAAAIGRAVCKHEGWGETAGQPIDLRQSLLIRRAYTAFHDVVSAQPDPLADELPELLDGTKAQIEALLGSSISRFIRVNDRCNFRRLVQKVEEFRALGDSADPQDGLRIWQDISAVAQMLVQINNRQELVEHDREQSRRLLMQLSPGDGDGSVLGIDLLARLSALHGRDADLDRAIQVTEAAIQRHLIPALRAVAKKL